MAVHATNVDLMASVIKLLPTSFFSVIFKCEI